ncbi:MAG: cation transporter, partial [Halomonas venusta]|nr:cation transporter [Halomonas venusta]
MQPRTLQPQTLSRTVPGMTCQGCVKRMREAVQAVDPNAYVEGFPAEKRLEVTSTLANDVLDSTLSEAGYPPGASSSETHPSAQSDTAQAADMQTAEYEALTSAPQQRLLISGMTCAGCVNSVEKALANTPGVTNASVNFGTHTAQVTGNVEREALINAVAAAGYHAEPI